MDWEDFEGRPDVHRSLLLKLVEHATDDDGLSVGCVAAGPLEDFISDNEDDLQWLETEGATNPRLRKALLGVWCAGHVTGATLARLDALAGEQLARPRPASELAALRAAEQRLDHVAGGMAAFQRLANPSAEQRRAAEAVMRERRALLGSDPIRPCGA